jgi:hypothetical protein
MTELILDGENLLAYLTDDTRQRAERIATMLARGEYFAAELFSHRNADRISVLAKLSGAINYANTVRQDKSTSHDERDHARNELRAAIAAAELLRGSKNGYPS